MGKMTKQLSRNFHISEFLESAGIVIKPTPQQHFCLYVLCQRVLQPIRNQFGSVKITSGLRNKESYDKLIEKGYPASKTSDHFAWCDMNPKGSGAADFYCPSQDMEDVFHWILKNLYHECRQIIYYPDMNIVHVSNHYNHIFKMEDNINSSRRIMIKRKGFPFKPYTPPWLCS